MLKRNYRSHQAIIDVYSPLFYQSQLQSFANPVLTNSLLGMELLPNPKIPILFNGVEGKEKREGKPTNPTSPLEPFLINLTLGRVRFLHLVNLVLFHPW